MTTTTTRPTQDALFDEPELNEALAAFATLANKISDAAANYITRANKEFNSKNPTIHGRNVFILNETVREAKKAVQVADRINLMLRHGPYAPPSHPETSVKGEPEMIDVQIIDDQVEEQTA